MSSVTATISDDPNALSARIITRAQAMSAGLQPAVYDAGAGAMGVELSSHNGNLRLSVAKTLNVFDTAAQSTPRMSSIYWPWVICTEGRIDGALGKYYMYYSGDHVYAAGWIGMAYSDSLLSGWTDYGKVFRNYSDLENQTTPLETETPSVIWNDENGEFIMYFHSSNTYEGEAQTSWYLTSPDGLNWSNRTKMLDIDVNRIPSNVHHGYAHPFEYGGTLFCYTLMGGGNGGTAISYSIDGGYHWRTRHRFLGRWCLNVDGYSLYAHHGTIVHIQGMDYWIGIMQNFSYGTQQKIARIVMVPMADMIRPFGKPQVLFAPTHADCESDNLRSFSIYQEGNTLYLFYHCRVDTNNVFNVAVMQAANTASSSRQQETPAPTVSFIARPANASVTVGSVSGSLTALASASDGSAVTYQWYCNTSNSNVGGTIVSGATGASMSIPTSLAAGTYYYYCAATSATAGTATSSVATVTARVTATVSFTMQPSGESMMAGSINSRLVVQALASDGSAVTYQWYCNASNSNSGGTIVSGAASATMIINTALTAGTYYYYCAAASATAGTATSSVATVTVYAPEVLFTSHPANISVNAGSVTGSLTALASASDGSAVTYQWYCNTSNSNVGGTIVSGATGASMSMALVPSLAVGTHYYYCVATSATAGSAKSNVATVTVSQGSMALGTYVMSGTPLGTAPAVLTDSSGRANNLTVTGITAYDADGYLAIDGAGEMLSCASFDMNGYTHYKLHIAGTTPTGVATSHRILQFNTLAAGGTGGGLMFSKGTDNSTGSVGVLLESYMNGSTPQYRSLGAVGTVFPREDVRSYSLDMEVFANSSVTFTVSFKNAANQEGTLTFTPNYYVSGITTALAGGFCVGNRPAGDRALGSSITEFSVTGLN